MTAINIPSAIPITPSLQVKNRKKRRNREKGQEEKEKEKKKSRGKPYQIFTTFRKREMAHRTDCVDIVFVGGCCEVFQLHFLFQEPFSPTL